jgi:TPR repeat protein
VPPRRRGRLARSREQRLHAALRDRETAAARALVASADAGGLRSERLAYYRALLLVQEGDLEEALAAARPLRAADDGALRAEADRIVASVAKILAYRTYTGDGAPRDPWLGLAFMEEACAAGDAESCRNAERVRGRRERGPLRNGPAGPRASDGAPAP